MSGQEWAVNAWEDALFEAAAGLAKAADRDVSVRIFHQCPPEDEGSVTICFESPSSKERRQAAAVEHAKQVFALTDGQRETLRKAAKAKPRRRSRIGKWG